MYLSCVAIGVGSNNFTEPLSKLTEVTYDGWFGSGSISLSVQIEKEAYEIGESIVISAQISNQSNKRIKAIQANLRHYNHLSNNPHHHNRWNIIGIHDRNVQATGSFNWTNQLLVPITAPPTINTLNSSVLKVKVIVAFGRNVCIRLPVNIVVGPKSVEILNPYAARAMGSMTQAYTANLPHMQPYTS